MRGIEWARASQFNWTFDNCGGTPRQDVICGLWSGVTFAVQSNQVRIPESAGGGKVYYLRGVWKTDALFAWGGFWVDPEAGDVNYYTGGSFQNIGNETIVTLGTSLPDGTHVQAYYVYNTGEKAKKYAALNSIPCMRPAWRSATDYTYDFAVDRIFDAMAAVYFAFMEQGIDYEDILKFFWNTYISNAASNGTPLVFDNFERQWFDKGSYLMYADSTHGLTGFAKFGTEIPKDDATYGRALRFKPAFYRGPAFAAWFGYGFNWDLSQQYFNTISKIYLKVKSKGIVSRVQKFVKTAGPGTSTLILVDGFNLASIRYYKVAVTKAGAPGMAEAILSVYDSDLKLLNDVDPDDGLDGEIIVCPSSTHPVHLGHGLKAYWEDGVLQVGDTWLITCGGQEIRPNRLKLILNDSRPADLNPFGETHTFVHAIPDYYTAWRQFEIDFSQFWRLGNIIDCRDRKAGRWGNWSVHTPASGKPYEILFYDIEAEETIGGKIFYTKQRFTWNLDPTTLQSLGFYVGVPNDVNSTGKTNLNYLIKHYHNTALTFRTKVRDADGRYFYHDDNIPQNEWVRISINLSSFLPEGGGTLTHPLTLVDIGLANSPPAQGSFDLCDLKFDNHLTFTGANNLRIIEGKHQEGSVIPKDGGVDWYIDDFGFDLTVNDPYPYAPRLAISLNAYGRNHWRGPTLVHYSHPLAPYLVNRFDIKNTELALHVDAQDEFHRVYGGVKGPIMPVHTRNDVENIALCGEENFNRFTWWPKYRDFGREVASWRFNGTLTDKAGTHTLVMSTGDPVWSTGICQPGNTSLVFGGTTKHAHVDGGDFHIGSKDFIIEAVVKFNNASACGLVCRWDQTGNQRSWLLYRNVDRYLCFGYSTDGSTTGNIISYQQVTDNAWHHIVVTRRAGLITFFLDGVQGPSVACPEAFFQGAARLRLGTSQGSWPGYLNGAIDYAAVTIGRGMEIAEAADRWAIIRGQLNGSDYPEAGHGLGQYWAFYRLGEYFFVSHDAGAWDILDNWLTWLSTYLVADGPGWQIPVWFSDYGFTYGAYDPGAAASIVVGCLYVYMRKGDSRALDIAQKLLLDLRLNRASGEYGGYLYKSDYHYAWMNALVAHAFGMAVVGRAGAAYRYPYLSADQTHYQNMMNNFFALSGDTKPNLLNADLIPFHDCEPHDIWDYAPHYIFMKEMGSMEGVVLMMHTALDWAKYSGSWQWFNALLEFMIDIGQAKLGEHQLFSVSSNYVTSHMATKVSVSYGDYRRDNNLYVETANAGMMELMGETRRHTAMHYGSPVITEDADTAAKIAARTLEYFSTPREIVQVAADLSAARIGLNDAVQISAQFHGYTQDTFALHRRVYDHQKLRVTLDLVRPSNYAPSWALDVAGGDYASYAIDTNAQQDKDWQFRTYGN